VAVTVTVWFGADGGMCGIEAAAADGAQVGIERPDNGRGVGGLIYIGDELRALACGEGARGRAHGNAQFLAKSS